MASTAMEDQLVANPLLVTFATRLSLLVLFGYQFRRPLKPVAQNLLLGLCFLFVIELGSHAPDPPTDTSLAQRLGCYHILCSAESVGWYIVIPFAASIVYGLHHRLREYRLSVLWSCVLTALLMASTNSGSFQMALPFPMWNFRAALTVFCSLTATIYQSWDLLWGAEPLQNLAFAFIRWARENFQTSAEEARQEEQAADVRIAQRHEEVSQSTQPTAPRPARWDTLIQYDDLIGDKIRILELLPLQRGDSSIRCHLRQKSLNEIDAKYIALSYNWGHRGESRTIHIQVEDRSSTEARVPLNLYDALHDLRRHDVSLLWIDALCINQTNTDECDQQLLKLHSIFRRAGRVMAWVGAEDRSSAEVMNYLASQDMPYPNFNTQPVQIEPTEEAFGKFVDRAYWRRVWIVQEIAAASQVFVVSGGLKAPLERLERLINNKLDDKVELSKRYPDLVRNCRLIKGLLDIRHRRQPHGERLLQLLSLTQACETSDPYDKVYAILGLATDRGDFMRWAPSYKTPQDVMSINMAKSYIMTRRCLDIILAGSQRSPSCLLPSWCPDFFNLDQVKVDDYLINYIANSTPLCRLGFAQDKWSTTSSSSVEEHETVWFCDNNILEVECIRIDRIAGIAATSGPEKQLTRVDSILDPQITGRRRTIDAGSYSIYNGLCRILLLYHPKYAQFTSAPIVLGMLYQVAYKMWAAWHPGDADNVLEWLNVNAKFNVHGKSLKHIARWSASRMSINWVRSVVTPKADVMMYWDYSHITAAVSRIIAEGLHLMTLERDGVVGWAHPNARTNDEVFLLAGCSVPVILRKGPEPSTYRFVGHAYVDGCMDGSRWVEAKATFGRGAPRPTVRIA